MIIVGGGPRGGTRRKEATPITTQQIPETLERWGKNREKKALGERNAGKTGYFWGNVFRSKAETREL
jgi:hypothetical protein